MALVSVALRTKYSSQPTVSPSFAAPSSKRSPAAHAARCPSWCKAAARPAADRTSCGRVRRCCFSLAGDHYARLRIRVKAALRHESAAIRECDSAGRRSARSRNGTNSFISRRSERSTATTAKRVCRPGRVAPCKSPQARISACCRSASDGRQTSGRRRARRRFWRMEAAVRGRPHQVPASPLKRLSPQVLADHPIDAGQQAQHRSRSSPRQRDPGSTPPLRRLASGFQRGFRQACIAGVQLRAKWESSLSGNSGGAVAAQASFEYDS
jgi:hypothetical protein